MISGQDWVSRLDSRLHEHVLAIREPWLTSVAKVVTQLGSTVGANLILVAVAFAVAIRNRRILLAVATYFALVGGQLLRTALSEVIGRARPPRSDWLVTAHGHAFPSGHSATAVMAYALALALLWPLLSRRALRRLGVAVVVVVGVAVGLSRVYLGVHWPSDVLGGWAFGVIWIWICLATWRRWGERLEAR